MNLKTAVGSQKSTQSIDASFLPPTAVFRLKFISLLILVTFSLPLHAETVAATISWAQVATLSTPLNGKVSSVKVNIGDKVKKGQLLATLDPRPLQAEVQRAEAVSQSTGSNYQEQKRELERAEELFERTVLSQTELQTAQLAHSLAEADFRRAEAELEIARINLDYSKIRAPFTGVIVGRNIHPGEVVANQFQVTAMLKLAKSKQGLAIAVISAEMVQRLNTGDKAQVSYNGKSYTGKVRQIQPSENAQYTLNVEFKSGEEITGSGMGEIDF